VIEIGRKDHGHVLAKAAGCLLNESCDVILSRTENDRLLGGVIFYNYTGRSVAIHIAGFNSHWMSRDIIWVTFHYVFRQLKCESLFSEIRSGNITVIELAKKMGFKEEAIIPEVFPNDDLVVLRMREADCKWLRIKPRELTFKGNGGSNGR